MPVDRETPSIEGILGRPFLEAVEHLLGRLERLVPTRTWRDLVREQHDRAFAVAGAMEAALLADLAAAVRDAIEKGESIQAFRAKFMKIIEERGWKGFRGDQGPAQRAWRTRVIYTTNQAVAYAAGRYKQLVEGKYKYWIYFHSHLSLDPRPEHLAWDGTALPPDHPWWRIHYPPNGWGCRCYVVGARSMEIARALGARRFEAPTAPDDRSGIGEGWDYAPGASLLRDIEAIQRSVATRIDTPEIRADAQADIASVQEPVRWITADDAPDRIPELAREAGRELLETTLDHREPGEDGTIRQALEEVERMLADRERRAEWSRLHERQAEILGRLHGRIIDRLRSERPYGGVEPVLAGRSQDLAHVRDALVRLLPADWLAGVMDPVTVTIGSGRSYYDPARRRMIVPAADAARADVISVHEWLHHAQTVWPRLQNACTLEHAARTATEKQRPLNTGPGEFGRKDKYYHPYMGRENRKAAVPQLSQPYEVLTMAIEAVIDPRRFLEAWRAGDRRTIEFAIGLLRRWKP